MKQYTSQGFTLIELLVAIAVFSVIVVIGVGGFVRVVHIQREVALFIAAQSNASIALEEVARELRTGYLFCDQPGNSDPTNPQITSACQPIGNDGCTINAGVWTCNNVIDFYNAAGQEIDYRLAGGSLERSSDGVNFTPITGDNVNLNYLTFTILGNTEGDQWPPRITVEMGVSPSSTDPAAASDFVNLQTTISAREIDCTQGPPSSC